MPVRQWRRDYTTIVPPTTQESTSQNDIWAVELPHGMPKDSHLLPQHSQDLLRAARSGKIYKRSAPVEEEEVDVEAVVGDKLEKKDDDLKDRGYTVKAWKPVPRHQEGVDLEYLAKRRKGLITITSKPASVGPSLTKATVKTVDAAGNEYVQDVVVPQGQKVDGEVISQTTIPDPSTTVVGDGSAAPTPIKRKGPPKRKAKGSGRGRRKKPIAPTSAPQLPQVDGVALSTEGVEGVAGEDVSLSKLYIAGETNIESRELKPRMTVAILLRIMRILRWQTVLCTTQTTKKGKKARKETKMTRVLLINKARQPNLHAKPLQRPKPYLRCQKIQVLRILTLK